MFDPNQLQAMVAGFQQRIAQAKAEAAAATVEGLAGGGKVRVVVTGEQMIQSIQVDPSVMDDREMLEDLLVVAANDALRRSKELLARKMEAAAGGLPLPPGLL